MSACEIKRDDCSQFVFYDSFESYVGDYFKKKSVVLCTSLIVFCPSFQWILSGSALSQLDQPLRGRMLELSNLLCSSTHTTQCREQHWVPHLLIPALSTLIHAHCIYNTPAGIYRCGECPAPCMHDLPNSMRAPSSS